jgi:hypothetical protein
MPSLPTPTYQQASLSSLLHSLPFFPIFGRVYPTFQRIGYSTRVLELNLSLFSKGTGFLFFNRYFRYAQCSALCLSKELIMPTIASLEDLRDAQEDLLQAKDIDELKRAFRKCRKIGWKNICKLWLEERTPEQLKSEVE